MNDIGQPCKSCSTTDHPLNDKGYCPTCETNPVGLKIAAACDTLRDRIHPNVAHALGVRVTTAALDGRPITLTSREDLLFASAAINLLIMIIAEREQENNAFQELSRKRTNPNRG